MITKFWNEVIWQLIVDHYFSLLKSKLCKEVLREIRSKIWKVSYLLPKRWNKEQSLWRLQCAHHRPNTFFSQLDQYNFDSTPTRLKLEITTLLSSHDQYLVGLRSKTYFQKNMTTLGKKIWTISKIFWQIQFNHEFAIFFTNNCF